MTILKCVLLIFISLFFISCSQTTANHYSPKENIFLLGPDKENIITIKFTQPIYIDSFNSCTNFSYTINDENKIYGNLFIESINLEHNCDWNGLSVSFFESDFKNKLNLSSIEIVEEFDIKNYNFKTYLINQKSYMSLIYIFGPSKDVIILDYEGKLYDKVLKSSNPDYSNNYISQKRYRSNYNESLVRNNMFNGYFNKEKP